MAKSRKRRSAPRYRPQASRVRAALLHGKRQAQMALERRPPRGAEEKGGDNGLLIAEGDSWFDYPFFDVLEELEQEFDYDVESVAHMGDTVEEMAYDTGQLSKLASKFQKLGGQGRKPRAILLSGGGNDIAGDEFAIFLNHKSSGLSALNDRIVAGVLEDRVSFAVVSLIGAVTELSKKYFGGRVTPVLLHGYDYPVPDGRGYLGGFWILPGPWLEPGFRQKGYADLKERCTIMVDFIDRFNDILAAIAKRPELPQVTHVDLRGTLSNDLAGNKYKKWWGNELHPTEDGFVEVARKIHAAIKPFPIP